MRQILDLTRLTTEEESREEYLGVVTKQLLQEELEDEELDSPHYQAISTENGWRERPQDFQISYEAERIVKELWMEESQRIREIPSRSRLQ
ncbi:hypothetical protein [Corynebacterium pacaense]|uniref:hypothetical protein n=1 Tax=Corynebacterium pacaense TaxID=1816684 RepID=UPI0009BC6E46|nr:hypothetical protein [Corynebacterium pacaense]